MTLGGSSNDGAQSVIETSDGGAGRSRMDIRTVIALEVIIV